MTREEFFENVENLLGEQSPNSTIGYGRWRRGRGGGRFPDHGLIRWFSPEYIVVLLHTPSVQATFSDPDSALVAIRIALT